LPPYRDCGQLDNLWLTSCCSTLAASSQIILFKNLMKFSISNFKKLFLGRKMNTLLKYLRTLFFELESSKLIN
jgi:hypothetical protein